MSVPIKNYLANRRNRMVGSIMGYLEAEVFPHLPKEQGEAVRRLVRDAVNQYHDSVLDLVKADDGSIRNEEVLALLERIAQNLPGRRLPAAVHQTGTPREPMLREKSDLSREVG